jgi:hypothetical protein
MKAEERQQIRLTTEIETAQVESENTVHDQENNNEDVGQWGRKITGQFPFTNDS